MSEIKIWFEPLLWIFGTIAALITFARLCKPVVKVFQKPSEMSEAFEEMSTRLDVHFAESAQRSDQIDKILQQLSDDNNKVKKAQTNLLGDRLSQGYTYFKRRGTISQDGYRSLCELYSSYKLLGGNSYIDTVMEQIEELYKSNSEIEP